jgi:RND family efflux transporter MFP subunit
VLAEIETPDLDAQLAAAQAKLNSARAVVKIREAEEQFAHSTYQRWRDSPKGVVSVQEQESQEADYNSAKARLSSANAEVAVDQGEVDRLQALESFKRITVPFDGVVTARETDIGALINAGSGQGPELFRVADKSKLRIYIQVPQNYASVFVQGTVVKLVFAEYPGRTFDARMARTAQALDPASRTLLVQLETDNTKGDLLPGGLTEVHLKSLAGNPSVRLPASALMFRAEGLRVATFDNGHAKLHPISIGRDFGKEVEVLTGIDAGQNVILDPPDSLVDDEEVRVAKNDDQNGGKPTDKQGGGADAGGQRSTGGKN